MKNLKFLICFISLGLLLGCSEEENSTNFVNDLEAPSNVSALFKITQNNSGLVTIRPNGDNVTQYEVFFGDNSAESAIANAGDEVTHTYAEGNYEVKIVATNYSGKSLTITQDLTVSFLQPTDMIVDITTGTNLSVNVKAKAELETYFQIYFGEDPNQTPVEVMEDQVATHNYSQPGTYQITVVALSGGAATLEQTFEVNITNLVAAPNPVFGHGNVISLFSNSYNNVNVNTWKTEWSQSDFEEVDIAGNAALKYSNLGFVGAEATNPTINATEMTHFYLNLYSEDFEGFAVKLVDFGADGNYGGGDDVEHEYSISGLTQGQWNTVSIPLSDFTNLTTRAHIAQIIFVGNPFGSCTVYVDNVLFYKEELAPTTAAPIPSHLQANVISLFSNTYTNTMVDTFKTSWSNSQFAEYSINGDDVLKYFSLDFVGIETVNQMINATSMNYIHLDVWSPNFETFKIKLVDFGADAGYGGGDDVEHELIYNNLPQGEWISLEIPLSNFTGLTTRAHIAQLIFAANPTSNSTVYIDNIYFHN